MNAKIIFAAVLLGFGPLLYAGSDYRIPETIEVISKVLGKDWKISSSANAITIESTFDVWKVIMISRPSRPPDFSPDTGEDQLAHEAAREHYIIRLEYGDLVDRAEFEKRIAERKKYADILRFGATGKELGKDEWAIAFQRYLEIRIPRYRGFSYSIYRVTPDRPAIQIYPGSAVAKIGAAKELLDALMGHRESPYD